MPLHSQNPDVTTYTETRHAAVAALRIVQEMLTADLDGGEFPPSHDLDGWDSPSHDLPSS